MSNSSSNPLPRIVKEAEKIVRAEYRSTDHYQECKEASQRRREEQREKRTPRGTQDLSEYLRDPANQAVTERITARRNPKPSS